MELRKLSLIFVLLLGFSMLLAACSGESIPETGGELPAEAVIEAQRVLSQDLNVSVEDIQIEETEQVEWPDACLGLPEEGEACAQVITPGWRAVVQAEGNRYELRSDETGNVVRWQQLN